MRGDRQGEGGKVSGLEALGSVGEWADLGF